MKNTNDTLSTSIGRRRFLMLSSACLLPQQLFASKTVEKPKYQLGLSQYSLRKLIFDKTLDPLDYPAFAKDKFGISAIDYWEGGLPKEKLDDAAYLESLKAKAADANSDLFLLMTGALIVDPEEGAKNLEPLKQSVWRAKMLGARYLRVFLKAPKIEEEKAVDLCVEAFKPLADHAQKHNVMIVVEPGASKLARNGAFLAKIMVKLNHPGCKLMPDFGKLHGDIYKGTMDMMPHSVSISCKMHSFDDKGKQPHFDYVKLMKIITDTDYSGLLTIEWEGNKLEPVEGVLASKKLIEDSLKLLGKEIS